MCPPICVSHTTIYPCQLLNVFSQPRKEKKLGVWREVQKIQKNPSLSGSLPEVYLNLNEKSKKKKTFRSVSTAASLVVKQKGPARPLERPEKPLKLFQGTQFTCFTGTKVHIL